jgi:predicted nucleotidyltransferase
VDDAANLRSKILAILDAQPEIQLAWIYGSFAYGTPRPDSDVDIAIACSGPLNSGPLNSGFLTTGFLTTGFLTTEQRADLATRLSSATSREVDLVDLSSERGIIASQVLTRGKLILNKDSALLARLIQRMWYDRADFWPQRERIFAARRKKAFGA